MSRATPEWIGATDDTAILPRVRLRVFDTHGGICHITNRNITPADDWDCDHVTALCNGGENRESNLAPAIRAAHREKTAEDVAIKARDRRIRQKHLGIKTVKRKIGGKRFNGEPIYPR